MEINFLNLINQHLHGSNFINQIFKIISFLGEKGLVWLALGAVLLCFKKTRKVGFITIAGVATTFFINSLILKNIFDRARPFTQSPELATFIKGIGMNLPDSNSFPSGHTFVSFCCAIILGLGLKKKWWLVYIPAVLIAVSRVFLCVHYPTDVIAGAAFGTVVGIAIYFAANYVLKKLDQFILNKRNKKHGATNSDTKDLTEE